MKNRTASRILLVLLLVQLLIDLFVSVTAFPFLHYGMYSARFAGRKTTVYEIWANGRMLKARDFPVLTWDLLHSPLAYYEKDAATLDFTRDKQAIREGFTRAGIPSLFDAIGRNLDNPANLPQTFFPWYKSYLERILRYPLSSLLVYKVTYQYTDGQYQEESRYPWIHTD
ncbi:MAG TPA: hypothetical protein VG870_02450 [Chitinophagaceae bacterium]|nr:hypothetical protein [Chitinophagaceae bacterium]